jgi:hypothetical protein
LRVCNALCDLCERLRNELAQLHALSPKGACKSLNDSRPVMWQTLVFWYSRWPPEVPSQGFHLKDTCGVPLCLAPQKGEGVLLYCCCAFAVSWIV